MARRGLPEDLVRAVAEQPEQRVPGHGGLVCCQSRVSWEGRTYLVRIVLDVRTEPPRVVTVYRTSKVTKYWRAT
ncbi:MAG: hypothetical protein WDA75_08980 [Candidatus Latescibacterota bacterium]